MSSSAASVTSMASASVDLSSSSSYLISGRGMPRSVRRSLSDPFGAAASSLARLEAFLQEDLQADLSGRGDNEDDSIQEELRRLRESEEGIRNDLEGLWLAGAVGGWRDDGSCSSDECDLHEGLDLDGDSTCQYYDEDDDDEDSVRLEFDQHHSAAHISSSCAAAAAPQSVCAPPVDPEFRIAATAVGGLSVRSRRRGSSSSELALDLAGLDKYEAQLKAELQAPRNSAPPSPVSTEGSLSSVTIHGMDIFAGCSPPPPPVLAEVCEEESLVEGKDEMIGWEVEFETPVLQSTTPPRHSEASVYSLVGLLHRAERAAEALYGSKDGGTTVGKGGRQVEPYYLAAGIAALVWIAERTLVA